MKKLALLALLAIPACSDVDSAFRLGAQPVTQDVTVLGRTWAVWQVADAPLTYKAQRDNNNFNPYGPPAVTRTRQAIRAFETATGCRVVRSSLYQNDMGQFYAQMSCPAAS